MGISAGPDYVDMDDKGFHLEAKEGWIAVWARNEKGGETAVLLALRPEMARRLSDDLRLHAHLIDDLPLDE